MDILINFWYLHFEEFKKKIEIFNNIGTIFTIIQAILQK